MLEDVDVRVNMNQLKQISQVSKITRDDLPANVTLETFDKLFSNLKNKVENNNHVATIALNNLDTTWVTIETPILGDPTQQLRSLLKNSEGNLSETEIKWKAVLSNVLDKDNNKIEGKFFTEQEEVFIITMMGIQKCSGGKEVGIASSYELLESKFRYQIKLSKALSVMEIETEDKKIKGVNFVKEFMNSQLVDTPIDTIADNLVKYVMKDRDRTINITPRIEDESFWTEDLALNKLGALELLKIVKREEIKDFISQLIGQKIQKLIEFQFSGTNDLMKELTGLDVIEQVAHQSIYLKNLIGHLVGVSQTITFDRHTSALCDGLAARNRDDVLSVFFKYMTPKVMVNKITMILKEAPVETINALKTFLAEDKYWENATLNKLGVLELLRTLDYLV